VANTSWSVYNFRLGLIRELRQSNYHVVVVAPKDAFTSKLIKEGIEYYEIEMYNYGTKPWQEMYLIFALYSLYRKIKPDLIFHYTIKPNIYGSMAAYFCGIPSIIITTGLGHLFEFKNFMVRTVTMNMYRIACRLSAQTWFLNSNDQDVFVYKRIVPKTKTKLINGEGVNTEWYKPISEKEKRQSLKFLFAGRLLKDKGIREFVEVAKLMKNNNDNCQFTILGFIDQSNPNSVPYEDIIKWQEKGWIKYEGETTDVRPYIESHDCLVFPSYYREGISRILMEAASMETPIITTDNVGCREIVDHNVNGYLCTPRDINSLYNSIMQFSKLSHQDRSVMGKLGRRKMIREFDERIIIVDYIKTIQNLIKGSKAHNDNKVTT
jgi:glycosyltransferase involved in cell wall biosynthesis